MGYETCNCQDNQIILTIFDKINEDFWLMVTWLHVFGDMGEAEYLSELVEVKAVHIMADKNQRRQDQRTGYPPQSCAPSILLCLELSKIEP